MGSLARLLSSRCCRYGKPGFRRGHAHRRSVQTGPRAHHKRECAGGLCTAGPRSSPRAPVSHRELARGTHRPVITHGERCPCRPCTAQDYRGGGRPAPRACFRLQRVLGDTQRRYRSSPGRILDGPIARAFLSDPNLARFTVPHFVQVPQPSDDT